MDPTKIIYYERSGNPKNEPPAVVAEWNSCRNHTSENDKEWHEGRKGSHADTTNDK